MKYSIENSETIVSIALYGAELLSVINKKNGYEYMWQADPNFWPKTSPILFPIVGSLKNDTYKYSLKEYNLPRHGFARNKEWEVVKHSKQTLILSLKSDNETLRVFPFKFEIEITYKLFGKSLSVGYLVKNRSDENIYFSLGAHPAFACATSQHINYTDYYLQFEKKEDFIRWPINENGLIIDKPISLNIESNILKLSYSLFYNDALVFKNLKSKWVILKCLISEKEIKFSQKGFPYLGIWAAKNADFVCIEPWCGLADSEAHNQNLIEKEGIVKLKCNSNFKRKWNITLQ